MKISSFQTGKHLKQKREKHKSLFKGVKQHKKKKSLNQETKTTWGDVHSLPFQGIKIKQNY